MSHFTSFDLVIKQFTDEMIARGVAPPRHIEADGLLHRYHIEGDRPGSKNGWYSFFPGRIPGGISGNWKTGISSTWCSKSKSQLSPKEWAKHKKRMNDARLQRDKLKLEQQAYAAEDATKIWDLALPADLNHPYLRKKQIPPYIARQFNNKLILPILDFDYKVSSLQFIDPAGSKLLLFGGAKKGRFIPINILPSSSKVLICEGYATGASLAEAYPDATVIAAIDAGNLVSVAIEARKKWPTAEIFICADDDRLTPGNPGLTNARKAANAIGAILTKPEWPADCPIELSDFNDLACWLSTEAKGAL